jgi:1,4-dihydroxy-2-naphthoate octaprenyltransferase
MVLYYMEVSSLPFVVGTVVAAMQNKHWFAALVCVLSAGFLRA